MLLLVAALAGCTTLHPARVSDPHPAANQTPPGMQCQMQRITGSLVATRVCTLKEQRDQIQRSTQDARDFLDHQVIAACPGTPGC